MTTWALVLGVLTVTVLVHALLTAALVRARERHEARLLEELDEDPAEDAHETYDVRPLRRAGEGRT